MLENQNKQNLPAIFFSLVFLLATIAFLVFVDPFQASAWVMIGFYICAAVFLYSVFKLFLSMLHSPVPTRQALFLTFAVLFLLFLSSRQLLHWWTILIFFLAIIMIEAFFLAE